MDGGYDQTYEDRLLRADPLARRPVTACSRSGTSLATATGSTGCGRATACSSRGPCCEQVGGFDESFADRRAAGTRTSSSTSGSAPHPASPCARSSARAPSTRCTAAPRPTSPTPPNGAPGCSATARSTPSSGGAPSRAPANRSTTSVGSRTSPPAARSRVGCRPTPSPTGAAARLHDGRPERAHAAARRAPIGLHRGGVAQPPVDEDDLARGAGHERAHRPPRLPGDDRERPARLDRRDGRGGRRAAPSTWRRSASSSATAPCCPSATCPRAIARGIPASSTCGGAVRPRHRRGRTRDRRRRAGPRGPRGRAPTARRPTGSSRPMPRSCPPVRTSSSPTPS